MKHNAKRLALALCGVVVMLAMNMAGITAIPVHAAGNGIYIATATPHYRHPQTGVIEDSGGDGSAVLGQSMTDSATYKQALVEVDSLGNTFVTVRLQLMDNIQNPTFQVDGSPVTAEVMQEDYSNNTADYRMKVNSENSVIRCNMYVIAMGRSVIFYITVSDLQPGSGDFITSITVDTPSSGDNGEAQGSAEQSGSGDSGAGQTGDSQAALPEVTEAAEATTETESTTAAESTTAVPSSTAAIKSSGSNGLQEFDASGKQVNETVKEKPAKKTNPAPFIIIGVVVVAVAAGCGVWFYVKRKK